MTLSPPRPHAPPYLLVCLLVVSSRAWAQPPPAAPVLADAPPWSTRVGVRLGVGVPNGLDVAALVQPRPWLRILAGASRNSLGPALRAGVDLLPLRLFVSPVLGLEYGHAFQLDYEGLLSRLHGQPTPAGTRIRQVDAEQLSASVGLEYSPWRPVTLAAGVGIGYWFIRVSDVKEFIRDAEDSPDITSTPLRLGLSTPVARLSLLVHFP